MKFETVEIDKREYEQLLEDSHFLSCLRNAGVDNWDGFDYAVEAFEEENAE
jgi:hypothetical protein